MGLRWMKALVKITHHSPSATGEGVDEVALADRADAAPEQASGERRAIREDRVGDEERRADGDDRVGDVRGVGRVGAAGAVELAPSGKVVAGLLEQPGNAVGDGTALGGRRAAIGLAVRGDGTLEIAVADELLGDAPPSEPGTAAAGLGCGAPGREGARLVIGPVASRADGQPGLAGDVGVGMPGQGLRDRGGRIGLAAVEEPAGLVQGLGRVIGHRGGLCGTSDDRREIGTSAVVAQPLAGARPGVGREHEMPGYLARCRKSITSS